MFAQKAIKSVLLLGVLYALFATPAFAGKKHKKDVRPWNTLPMPLIPGKAKSTGYIKSGAARIYYAIYGEGEPLILLHGGLGNGDHWGGQIAEFSATYKVITIDSRGHGRSTLGNKPLSYSLMASDVLAVMNGLQLEKTAILGWSDGGNIGLSLAISDPERLSKVVLFGANYDISGIKPRKKGNTTFPAYMKKARADYQKLSRTPKKYGVFIKKLSRMWRTQPRFTQKQLRSINIPVAVSVGEHDEIIKRSHTDKMAKLIPGARKIVIPDLSHFAMWQSPEAFNQQILKFLNSPSGEIQAVETPELKDSKPTQEKKVAKPDGKVVPAKTDNHK